MYILLRMVLYWSSFGILHWIGFVLTSVGYYFCHSAISSLATPTYDEQTKELIDGGADLNMKDNISQCVFESVVAEFNPSLQILF